MPWSSWLGVFEFPCLMRADLINVTGTGVAAVSDLVVAKFVKQVFQLFGLQFHVPLRIRLVIRPVSPDLRHPSVAVDGRRPPPPSGPVQAMITGDDNQCARAGMITNQLFQQVIRLAATWSEADL